MLPTLTCSILTYKRPWYALITLAGLIRNIRYDGVKRYCVIDGGSPDWQLEMYRLILKDYPYEIVNAGSSFPEMMNRTADQGGEVWISALDDFVPDQSINVTNDVKFLLQNEDVGCLRYGQMSHWDVPQFKVYAEMRACDWCHYWVLDRSRSTISYMWTLGFTMMHRRMWDHYGPLPAMTPHQPGETELQMNRHFAERAGPTVAIPMRIGEPSDTTIQLDGPIRHIGHVRTDEYTNLWNQRWGAT